MSHGRKETFVSLIGFYLKENLLSSAFQVLVENVDTESVADADQVGVQFGDLVDDSGLLLQQAILDEVGQVRIGFGRCGSVQVQQRLQSAIESFVINVYPRTEFGVGYERTWLSLLAMARTNSMATSGVSNSCLGGWAMGAKTTRPPRKFWYSMSLSALPDSLSERLLKK